ncbi:MAG: hypothetical protein CMA56_05590 [Euryarchaeota archaeon]|nr:hypothetical protein [Euryarchaeota archaeon]
MLATLDDGTVQHRQNFVGVPDGGQAMSDGDGGTLSVGRQQILLDASLGFSVQGAAGLVQDQQAGLLQDRASEADAGPLSTRQFAATVTHHGVEAFFEVLDEIPCTGGFEGRLDAFCIGLNVVAYVVLDRAVEQERLL